MQLTCSSAAPGMRILRAWSCTQPAICLSTAKIAANSFVKTKRTPAAINTPRAHVLHNQMHEKNETARQEILHSLLPPPSRTLSATNSQTAHTKLTGPLHTKQAPTSALGARRRRRGSPHHRGRRLPRLTWRGAHRHRRRRPSRPRRPHRHLPWRRRPDPPWRWAVLPHTWGRAIGTGPRGRRAVAWPGRGWGATRGHPGWRGPLGRGLGAQHPSSLLPTIQLFFRHLGLGASGCELGSWWVLLPELGPLLFSGGCWMGWELNHGLSARSSPWSKACL